MKRHRSAFLAAFGFLAVLLLPWAAPPVLGEVSVNINIGPPPLVVHEPPEVVVIPRTMVYFAPAVEVDLLFHNGYWWTRHEGRWFRSRAYNGPWVVVAPRGVPLEIVRVPKDYRVVYVKEKRVPHGQLKKHWKERERERKARRGEWKDWKEEKRDRKEHEKEKSGRGRGPGY